MIYIKNIRDKQTIFISRSEHNGKVVAVKSYDEGYADGKEEGKKLQKLKLTSLTVSENGVYKREDGWNEVDIDVKTSLQSKTINVTKDVEIVMADDAFDGLSRVDVNATQYGKNKRNEGYNQGKNDGFVEGYADGKTDGINEQKSKLESITITENGTYTKEDGYNSISVNVEDLNGGYDEGYNAGYDDALTNAGKTAQVLNITQNGIYTTKYSEPDEANAQVTGYFDDNTPFYGYAHLTNHTIATGIKPTKTSKVELWWRPDFHSDGTYQFIFANTTAVLNGIYLKVDGGKFSVKFGNYTKNNQLEVEDKWYHIVVSTDGLVIDGEKITTLGTPTLFAAGTGLFINGDGAAAVVPNPAYANGYFGMVKIDGKTFIPTEDGFIDYTTNIPLNVHTAGEYDFVEKPTYEGNLIRTVHVNVPQNTLKTQNKILTVTKELEVVYPDSGYNALAEVSVDATQYGQDKHSEGYTEGFADGKAEGGSITTTPLNVTPKWEDRNVETNTITYTPETYDTQAFSVVTLNVETLYSEGEEAGYTQGKTDGYAEGTEEGYANGYEVGIEEGYSTGKSDGISEQKSKLANYVVNENGAYAREDGYKYVLVSVPQTNYKTKTEYLRVTKDSEELIPDEGYAFTKVTVNATDYGQTKYDLGYNSGYDDGYDKGYEVGSSIQKISMRNGTKFAYSTFKKIPLSNLDWYGVKDMSYMFYNCENLEELYLVDTSSVTTMYNAFYRCITLETIPLLDTSKVTNMHSAFYGCKNLIDISEINTSSVTNMDSMFWGCTSLNRLPALDCSKVTSIDNFFGDYRMGNLLYFGGFINLKCSMLNEGLENTPNLTIPSCINVLNGLYDFTGNGETPTSSQGKLKVHQNFLDNVGDQISIATKKGWQITA